MNPNLQALNDAIGLLADAVNDSIAAAQPGESLLARLSTYENLVADVVKLVPEMGQIPADVSALSASDAEALVASLVGKLSIANAHAVSVINASLTLLNSLVTNDLPLVKALIAAVKGS